MEIDHENANRTSTLGQTSSIEVLQLSTAVNSCHSRRIYSSFAAVFISCTVYKIATRYFLWKSDYHKGSSGNSFYSCQQLLTAATALKITKIAITDSFFKLGA